MVPEPTFHHPLETDDAVSLSALGFRTPIRSSCADCDDPPPAAFVVPATTAPPLRTFQLPSSPHVAASLELLRRFSLPPSGGRQGPRVCVKTPRGPPMLPLMSPRAPAVPELPTRQPPTTGLHMVTWAIVTKIYAELKAHVDQADIPEGTQFYVAEEILTGCWIDVVSRPLPGKTGKGLSVSERELIEIRVAQSVKELQSPHEGAVELDDWVRHMLKTRAGPKMMQAMALIDGLMKEAMRKGQGILLRLQHAFQVVASRARKDSGESVRVRVSFGEVLLIFARQLWHLRPTIEGQESQEACSLPCEFHSPEEFADGVLDLMDMDGRSRIFLSDFLGFCLGRREHPVILHLYDLSRGVAKVVAPWLINQHWEGVWHTGIVVFGREYYFGGHIFYDRPSGTCFGEPWKQINLGVTLRTRDELHAHLTEELKHTFSRHAYDVATNNCNHFCDRVSMYLVGKNIPEDVVKQPEKMMDSQLGQTLRPVLGRWLGFKDSVASPMKTVALTDGSAADVQAETVLGVPVSL